MIFVGSPVAPRTFYQALPGTAVLGIDSGTSHGWLGLDGWWRVGSMFWKFGKNVVL